MVIDLDIRGFDIFSILDELYDGKKLMNKKKHLPFIGMCANGVQHNGWYYDSFATILSNQMWFYQTNKIFRSNILQKNRFTDAISCFGGLTVYNFTHIINQNCKYQLFNQNLTKKYSNIIDLYSLAKTYQSYNGHMALCEHVPFHACLLNNSDNNQKNLSLLVARDALVFYGDYL